MPANEDGNVVQLKLALSKLSNATVFKVGRTARSAPQRVGTKGGAGGHVPDPRGQKNISDSVY